jgi:membrane protease YdiL (CAAX protease family)
VRLTPGQGAVIAVVAYLVYVASSLVLYDIVNLRAAAALSSAVFLGTAYYLVGRLVDRPWRYVRLRGLQPSIAVYTVLAALSLIPVAASVMALVLSVVHIPEEWVEATYRLVKADNMHELVVVWLVTALAVPCGEEFVFRGVLQNSLAERYRASTAVLVASVCFAVLHVWRFPAAFILGLLLGALYVLTGSLAAPLVAHVTINTAVVGGTFLVERAGEAAVPGWLTKDTPAPAPVLAGSIAAFAFFLALLWKATRRRKTGREGAPSRGG